jgi:hypothetical protein
MAAGLRWSSGSEDDGHVQPSLEPPTTSHPSPSHHTAQPCRTAPCRAAPRHITHPDNAHLRHNNSWNMRFSTANRTCVTTCDSTTNNTNNKLRPSVNRFRGIRTHQKPHEVHAGCFFRQRTPDIESPGWSSITSSESASSLVTGRTIE